MIATRIASMSVWLPRFGLKPTEFTWLPAKYWDQLNSLVYWQNTGFFGHDSYASRFYERLAPTFWPKSADVAIDMRGNKIS